jgi:acyl carrier protein
MTVDETAAAGRTDERLHAEIVGLLVAATGEEPAWGAAITPATRLESDLRIESVEVTALAEMLRRRYGDRVDLPAFLAELDIDQLISLTVGDLVAYVARQT